MIETNEPNEPQEWYRDGLLHREDGPAVVHADGAQEWYLHGQRHRVGGPAIVYPDGRQQWWYQGKLHREDGPAIVHADGRQRWYRYGELHRVGGPAIVDPDRYEAWYRDDALHRLDGPAVSADGIEVWCLHGQQFASAAEHQHAVALAEHGVYTLYRVSVPGQPVLYVAGCRRFSLSEARAHWCESGSNRPPFICALAREA